MKKTLIYTTIILLGGCMSSNNHNLNDRVDSFLQQIDRLPATVSVENPEQKFLNLFGDFKISAQQDIIKELYADEFYFNDTFKTYRNLDELSLYLQETAKMVDVTRVEILDVTKSDTDYYLRWVMHMKFTAKGREVDSRSIGMTQIRFNDEGKVVLHQDYWDGAEGFYQHLPIVGYIVRKVRSSL